MCIVFTMHVKAGRSRVVVLAVLTIPFAMACVFFAYYAARLAYVNITAADIAAHRQAGMYIGAIAFPAASALSGWLTFKLARAAVRAVRREEAGGL